MKKKNLIDQKKLDHLIFKTKNKINLIWNQSLEKEDFSKIDILRDVYS